MAKGEKFKGFIKKASNVVPELVDIVGKLGTGQWGAVVKDVGELIFKQTKNENPVVAEAANELMIEFEKNRQNFILEGFRLQVEDRKSARDLFKTDGSIQKVFGIVFLVGYGFLSWYLLEVLKGDKVLNELSKTMITMIWTGTSTKLNTIIDFFFGGSMEKK